MRTGRPSLYDPTYHPEAAKGFFLLGYTDKEVCTSFGIAEPTFYEWKLRYPDFSKSCSEGKEVADVEVAKAFFKRATGYEYDSEKIVVVPNGGNEGSSVERVPITAVVLPDASAALKWLQNRRPKEWRDKIEISHKVESGDLSSLTDEEIEARLLELRSKRDG